MQLGAQRRYGSLSTPRRQLAGCAWHLLGALALLCLVSPAQAQFRFDLWTESNGLPQANTRDIAQTPDGYLWISTLDGLVRFDGVRFTTFNHGNTAGIASNRFGRMHRDAHGDLWLITEGGHLTRYHDGTFHTFGSGEGIMGEAVRGLADDEAGHIWILLGDSILRWNESTGRFHPIALDPGLHGFWGFLWEKTGFWEADATGLHCFIDGRFFTYKLPASLTHTAVRVAARDQDGAIWVEMQNGKLFGIVQGKITNPIDVDNAVLRYRDSNGHAWTVHTDANLERWFTYESPEGKEQISFHSIFEDREQNLWLASRGLYRLQMPSIHTYSRNHGLIEDDVYPIYEDRQGAVWIGAKPRVLSRFQGGKFTNFSITKGPDSPFVTALAEDSSGTLWVATDKGLMTLENGRLTDRSQPALPAHAITQAMYLSRDGTFWFGTTDGLVAWKDGRQRIFTRADGLATDDVRVILEDAAGDLWAGGYGGLSKRHSGQWSHWTEQDGLPSDNIRSLYEDRDGVLWIGTYDGGLGRYKDGHFTRYRVRDGLFDDGVFQILDDLRGNLWMSSNRGIYRVRKEELNAFANGRIPEITSIAYGKADGMINVECNGGYSPAGVRARDDKLWFPTVEGVAVVNPAEVRTNLVPPPVVIESALIDRKPAAGTGLLRIAPGQENLEIQYTALSFIHSDQIRFRYRMEGLDSGWIDAGVRRTAYYSHLPPGNYRFLVIAGNSDGVWNTQGQSIAVVVAAPFYRTWWFALIVCALIASAIAAAWRIRVAQLERRRALQEIFARQLIASQENERKRIAAELHDSLGQRLVVIKNLALFHAEASPADKRMIDEISAEASLAIRETKEISFNLRPFQLDRLGLTKAIEAILKRLSTASGIHFSFEYDEVDDLLTEELRIGVYRIVQEALNNVVKHADAKEAAIRILHEDGRMLLSIEDDGRGFTVQPRSSGSDMGGFGLTGMAERALFLGGKLKVRSAPGEGSVITVEIPMGVNGHGK